MLISSVNYLTNNEYIRIYEEISCKSELFLHKLMTKKQLVQSDIFNPDY